MNTLKKIQQLSTLLRVVVIAICLGITAIVSIGQLVYGEWWIAVNDEQFNQLWQAQENHRGLLSALISPLLLLALLGMYWLQRLFGEFQRGNFFNDSSMRCFLWLIWLKMAGFIYATLWPLLPGVFSLFEGDTDLAININIGEMLTLLLMLSIVHLLKAAQDINNENKAFV